MTARPADEARRALREARLRGETTPDIPTDTASGTGAHPEPDGPVREAARQHDRDHDRDGEGDRPPRPGDIARAALRGTRTARHTPAHDADAEEPKEPEEPEETAPRAPSDRTDDPSGPVSRPVPGPDSEPVSDPGPDSVSVPGPDSEPDAAPRPAALHPSDASSLPAPTIPDAGGTRPADVAREALRAARRQARADAESKEAAGTRRRPGTPRHPRPTAGDPRAADARARARAVRDFAADAFRLPPETDREDEDAPPPAAPEGPRTPGGPADVPPRPPAGGVRTPHPAEDSPPDRQHRPATDSSPPHGDTTSREARSAPPVPAAKPRSAPRSMAAPDRDGDLRRTFPALPPRAPDEGLAATWWGKAWVSALEEGALDAARLARGRGYAERGHVDAVTVTPGLVLAYVQGSRPRPYRVQVRLRTLGDDDWQRFLDAAVERPGHIAALLDGELPHSLAECGVPLLPGPGDLAPRCSCPDSGHPCKHAAALCYQTARLLDADPFVLLLLRGRGERTLLDALSRLNAARAARAAQDRGPAPLPGVRASAALNTRPLPPLPAPLPTPPHPEQPPAYPAAPGGPDPFALDQLATDAAARAHALLTTGRDPVGGLTLWQDAARLAAARPGSGLTAGTRALYASLAGAAGRDQADLARAVAAWRQGGADGLDVLEEAWDPPAGRFDRARPLLLAADLPAFRPWRNRLTHPGGHVQLRLGRSGLWYAYESEPGREDWWPRGTPDLDPVGALTGLGASDDL
ncbi:SWIM zinc finger family protein [Streptomyces sp. NPDC053780]|uniref:SWIM zinc finger family protein n=1 Tax=unclassified Streptomyces TaxID=2593676 RepID=UPI0034390750